MHNRTTVTQLQASQLHTAVLRTSLTFHRTVRPLHDLPTFFSGPRVRPLHDLPTFFRPGQERPKPAKVACWLRAQRLAEKRRKWGRLKRESCQIVLILHALDPLRLRDPPTLRSNPAMVSERLRWTSLGSEMLGPSRPKEGVPHVHVLGVGLWRPRSAAPLRNGYFLRAAGEFFFGV